MKRASIDGVEIEYEVTGLGSAVFLIHGSILADAFFPLTREESLARYKIVQHHRRGFAGSDHATANYTIEKWASDCNGLMKYLGIADLHLVGHSYGALIALQLTLQVPEKIRTLTLLEPPLLSAVPSGPQFMELLGPIVNAYQRGDVAGAIDSFLSLVNGPDYRAIIDSALPIGAFDLAVRDAETLFHSELPAMQNWSFTRAHGGSIRQPVLSVLGERSAPVFKEVHELLKDWIPQTEKLLIPRATHGLQIMNPAAVADGLNSFFGKHES
jgi:pimeloyl-ACP methyl ester carboxylesterase